MKRFLFPLLVIVGLSSQPAAAALVDIPVPDGAFIENYAGSGLDVAWAAPCRAIDPSCGAIDLSFQSGFGWRLASAAEAGFLGANLLATDFIFAGANVPLGGSDPNGANFVFGSPGADAACASPYFSPVHFHCDWGNAPGSGGGNVVGWGFGQPGESSFAEAIVVRDAVRVPEPGTLTLLGMGLLAMGAFRRSPRKARS